MAVEYGSLPFKEAVDYLRGKVNVPTESWTDIWEGQHAKAFTVAGATKDELLADLHGSINTAIKDGMTIDQFRSQFDEIVKRHGWAYNGGRNWRTRIIYETNMRTAYMAGRYEQLQKVKARRPYWQYKHAAHVKDPRPEHQKWDGKIWHCDDPIWDIIYPPNGWGCHCYVIALSERDLKRMGKSGPDETPDLEWEEKTVGVRGPNPRTIDVPKGIDPGWGYNVGKVPPGDIPTPTLVKPRKESWDPSVRTGWADAGRPERIPLNSLPVPLAKQARTTEEVEQMLRKMFDGEPNKTYQVADMVININARGLAQHFENKDLGRTVYLPLLDDLLNNPYEIWRNVEINRDTGKARIVARFVKAYKVKGGRYLFAVTEAFRGQMKEVTFFASSGRKHVNGERMGVLVLGSTDGDKDK